MHDGAPAAINPSNRLGLDYGAEALAMGHPPSPIIDVHTHISGMEAAKLYRRAARLYGIRLTYSMTQLEQAQAMREIFGDSIRFIAVPNWMSPDRKHEHGAGFIERIRRFYALGSRIVKFWAAPRGIDYGREAGDPDLLRLDSPIRLETMHAAAELGMIFMTHVSDPDTWFATKYADASIYGQKLHHYEALESLLERFTQPWIAAHMGGWPENLEFLAGLLQRHPNLYLDTSAAKWMIREISRHRRSDLIWFLNQFRGRILFGSDIVTMDEHLRPAETKVDTAAKASTPAQAFDLYASRYWALRRLWETDRQGESPIADPDLAMVDPTSHDEMSAPMLVGKSLPVDLLRVLYHDAAAALLEPLHSPARTHG